MIKIKSIEVKEEVLDYIKQYAFSLGIYDFDFPEENQCGGYFAFKSLCLLKGQIPTHAPKYNDVETWKTWGPVPQGYYILSRLHELIRQQALDSANAIRTMFKIN